VAKIGDYYVEFSARGESQILGALSRVRVGLARLGTAALAPVNAVKNSLSGLLAPLGSLSGGLAAIGVGAGVGGLVKLAADAESLSTAFEVLLGSQTKAQDTLQQLQSFAAATPFSIGGLSDATKTLLQFGLSAEDSVESIKMLSNVAMGNEEKLKSLSLVFGQIASAGRLTGGDLLQLINAGFNPLQIISEKTGKSMAQLRDEMSQGKITFEMVREAFQAATGEGGKFYQMNEKMSQTLAGRWSTFADAAVTGLREVGNALAEGLDLKGLLASATEWIARLGSYLRSEVSRWVPVIKGFVEAVGAVLRAAWDVISGALSYLGRLMTSIFGGGTRDFAEMIRSFLEEVTFFAENWKLLLNISWEKWKLWASNLWERIKTFFTNVGVLLEWLLGNWRAIFTDILNYGKTVFANLITNYKNLWTAFWRWIRGGGWEFDWTPLTEGFQSSIRKMPEFVEAGIKVTSPALEAMERELARRREEFYGRRKKSEEKASPGAPTPVAAASPAVPAAGPALAGGVAAGTQAIRFIGLEELARQMQEDVGRRTEEKIAEQTEKTADATERLASAVDGGAVRVKLEGPVPAAYS